MDIVSKEEFNKIMNSTGSLSPCVSLSSSFATAIFASGMLISTPSSAGSLSNFAYGAVTTSPSIENKDIATPQSMYAEETGINSETLYEKFLAMSVIDQACEILAALSLNKSQLAEILKISRPTLYSWFEGTEPNPENSDRLLTILRLMAKVDIYGASSLNARFVRNPLSTSGVSLLDSLKAEDWNEEELFQGFKTAKELTQKAAAEKVARQERSRKLGYPERSIEDRMETLNRNLNLIALDKNR